MDSVALCSEFSLVFLSYVIYQEVFQDVASNTLVSSVYTLLCVYRPYIWWSNK